MSVETFPKSTSTPDQDPDNINRLEAMFNAPAAETRNTPPLSPTGRALERVAAYLHKKANDSRERMVGSAHEQALDEYRDTDLEGYAGYMQDRLTATDEEGNPRQAEQEYARGRLANDRDIAHTEALNEYRGRDHAGYVDHLAKMSDDDQSNETAQKFAQRELNRENRREDRQEMQDKAKALLHRVGRNALNAAATAGLIGLGLSILGAEATARGARKAKASMKEAYYDERGRMAENAQMRKEAAQGHKQSRIDEREKRKSDARAERDQRRADKEADRLEQARVLRQEAILRAYAAARRKRERRIKWANRKEKIVGAFNSLVSFTGKQKRRIGRFAARAHAAGKAAKSAWENHDRVVEYNKTIK